MAVFEPADFLREENALVDVESRRDFDPGEPLGAQKPQAGLFSHKSNILKSFDQTSLPTNLICLYLNDSHAFRIRFLERP
jgi:hypothetical protein